MSNQFGRNKVLSLAGGGDVVKLVTLFVRHFAKAFNKLLTVTFHVVFSSFDICACADQLREQISVSTLLVIRSIEGGVCAP